MVTRNKVAALVAEFLGAGLLALIVITVQRSTIGVPYFIGIAAGLAVATLMLIFGRASGAHFNPAITLALWTARRIPTVRAITYIVAQLLGAYLAGRLYASLVGNKLTEVGGDFKTEVLIAEAVGAMLLALGWAAASYNRLEGSARAAVVGMSYVVGTIAASAASVGIINPAVALGGNAFEWGTYVLGPVLGAIIGVNLYGLLFAPTTAPTAAATAGGAAVVAEKPVVAKTTAEATASKPASTKKAAAKTTARKTTSKRSTTKKK